MGMLSIILYGWFTCAVRAEIFFRISSITALRFLLVQLNLDLLQSLGNKPLIFFLQKENQAFSESMFSNSATG